MGWKYGLNGFAQNIDQYQTVVNNVMKFQNAVNFLTSWTALHKNWSVGLVSQLCLLYLKKEKISAISSAKTKDSTIINRNNFHVAM
jgi:hypothetical protein